MPCAVMHQKRFHLLVLILAAVVRENAAWETTGVDPGDDAAREITGVDSVDFGDAASVWLWLKVSDGLDGGNPGASSQIEAVAVDACGIEMHAHGTLLKIVDDSEVMLGLGE